MNQRYVLLLTINVRHGYYGGECDDFEFVIPPSTATVLRNGRSLVRVGGGALQIWCDVGESDAPMAGLVGQTLWLGLRLRNTDFDNFTTPVIDLAGRSPLYSNRDNVVAFGPPDAVVLVGGVLDYVPRLSARPLNLSLLDESGATVLTHRLSADSAAHRFDLSRLPGGEYVVREQADNAEADDRVENRLVISSELNGAGFWGLVAIRVDARFREAPPQFSLAFSARRDRLKYYVIARDYSASDLRQLRVTDAGFGEEQRAQIEFERIEAESLAGDDLSAILRQGVGVGGVILFRSTREVVRRARGYRKLQLSRNGDLLMTNLPQPSPGDTNSHFLIHLSRPTL